MTIKCTHAVTVWSFNEKNGYYERVKPIDL